MRIVDATNRIKYPEQSRYDVVGRFPWASKIQEISHENAAKYDTCRMKNKPKDMITEIITKVQSIHETSGIQ